MDDGDREAQQADGAGPMNARPGMKAEERRPRTNEILEYHPILVSNVRKMPYRVRKRHANMLLKFHC